MSNPFTPVKLAATDGKRTVKGQAASQSVAYRQDHAETHPFAPLRQNNQVECFTNGAAYFTRVLAAMRAAKKSIFITGWQVNWDVELEVGTRLIDVLHECIKDNKEMRVYVLPWMSPKVGVDTGDLETMLAIFQLNAGLETMQAFCCPAGAQSDYEGSEGAAFSHHQKAIVVDNHTAFVGGIDLAWGRRDDDRFKLTPVERTFNERYNPGVPASETVVPNHGPCLSAMNLLSTTLLQGMWNAGGNSEPGALSKKIDAMLAETNRLAMEAVTGFVRMQSASTDAAKWFVEQNVVVVNGLASTSAESLVKAANAVSTQCSLMQVPNLYGSVQSMKVRSSPALTKASGLEEMEQGMRQEANATIHKIANLHSFLSPLDHMQVSEDPSVIKSVKSMERSTRATVNKTIDGASTVVFQVQEKAESGRQVCLQIGPTTERSVNAAKVAIKEGKEAVKSTVEAGVNFLQSEIMRNLNELRGAVSELILGTKSSARQAADKAMSEVNQGQIQAVIEKFKSLLKSIYMSQLAINWAHASIHPLLLDPKTKQAAGSVLGIGQPREPWQDAHCGFTGPAVYDVAMNFIARWNVCQDRYITEAAFGGEDEAIVRWLTTTLRNRVKIKGKLLPAVPAPQQPNVDVAVRVLRSASKKMCQQEAREQGIKDVSKITEQREIQNQMLNLIAGATDYIYIENQFFQTDFGEPSIDVFSAAGHKLRSGPVQFLMSDFANDMKAKLSSAKAQGKNLLPANEIGNALGKRIADAIRWDKPFHVYLVLPVHPEGMLNDIAIVGQIHWTMQSLVFAENSLLNQVKQAIAARALCKNPLDKSAWDEAMRLAKQKDPVLKTSPAAKVKESECDKYVTLLNLRTAEKVNEIVRTEQIYVHSKLLIVDDRQMIIGSANINDRSQSGKRDSELAVMLIDSKKEKAPLRETTHVNPLAREYRKNLWKKHFAISSGGNEFVKPASDMATLMESPASDKTIKAVQQIARANAAVYASAFAHVPAGSAPGNARSLWPVCPMKSSAKAAEAAAQNMPFEKAFWAKKSKAPALGEILGHFTALPIYWTAGENNHPGEMSVMLLTQNDPRDEATYANA